MQSIINDEIDYYETRNSNVLTKNETNNKDDKSTRDGEIGYTQQGYTGDCWLLSGVNALSFCERGSEIIKNALEHHEDEGYTIVHTYAGDYTVHDEEIDESKKDILTSESGKSAAKYSSGDDDMTIIEIAVAKIYNDQANYKIDIPFIQRNGAEVYKKIMC